MLRKTGQTAVEYLVVFSAALVFIALATTAAMIDPGKESAQNTLYLSQARNAADSIAEAINTVYINGPGAVKSVGIQMDTGWWIFFDNDSNAVKVSVGISSGTENLQSSVYYPIDNYHSVLVSSGLHTVIVEWPSDPSIAENLFVISENDLVYIYVQPGGR